MVSNKWCCENINSGKFGFGVILSELKEVVECKSIEELKEEISDVIYSSLCVLYDYTKIEVPMIGAGYTIEKAQKRFEKWNEIFKKEGLVFDKKFLVNGSNYEKVKKVEMALSLARESHNIL